jgi:hypothetical protein
MRAQEARVSMKVRVLPKHRIEERRGMVGRVVGCYGGEEYMAVDVRFADGQCQLFWTGELEEVSSPRPWWHALLGEYRESSAQ